MGTIHLTRKIQLLIDHDDHDYIYEAKGKIMQWQNMCYRCANLVYTHQFIQEQIKDLIYLTEDVKLKITDSNKDDDGMLISSRTNSTYKLLTKHFKGQMPSNIFNNLNNTLVGTFRHDKINYYTGERSIRNFKKNIAMPFSAECLRRLAERPDGAGFTFTLFGIPFKTCLGKRFDDKRELLREVIVGKRKLVMSYLKIEEGKVFLLATFEYEKEHYLLKEEMIAEATLSIEHPIIVNRKETINDRYKRRILIQEAGDTSGQRAGKSGHDEQQVRAWGQA